MVCLKSGLTTKAARTFSFVESQKEPTQYIRNVYGCVFANVQWSGTLANKKLMSINVFLRGACPLRHGVIWTRRGGGERELWIASDKNSAKKPIVGDSSTTMQQYIWSFWANLVDADNIVRDHLRNRLDPANKCAPIHYAVHRQFALFYVQTRNSNRRVMWWTRSEDNETHDTWATIARWSGNGEIVKKQKYEEW